MLEPVVSVCRIGDRGYDVEVLAPDHEGAIHGNVGRGSSRRHPKDPMDKTLGMRMALKRALAQLPHLTRAQRAAAWTQLTEKFLPKAPPTDLIVDCWDKDPTTGYVCCKPAGHSGAHVAWIVPTEPLARWRS